MERRYNHWKGPRFRCGHIHAGRAWSHPGFVFAGATKQGHIHSCSYIDMFADASRIHVFLGQNGRQLLYLHFDESDLPKLLTKADLAAAAANPLAKTIQVGGVKIDLARRMPEKAAALRGKLEQWREEVGAATPKPNPKYRPG